MAGVVNVSEPGQMKITSMIGEDASYPEATVLVTRSIVQGLKSPLTFVPTLSLCHLLNPRWLLLFFGDFMLGCQVGPLLFLCSIFGFFSYLG